MAKKIVQALMTLLFITSCKDPEDCTDHLDNDKDGSIDCDDSDCSAVSLCQSPPLCGDGVIEGSEQCEGADLNNKTCADFGFTLGTLSCSATCILDSSGCSNPTCGNGIIEGNEPCDDGNNSNTDACLSSCTLSSCGDGFTQIGTEGCDDNNTTAGDGCSALCQLESCGDGVIQSPETCDDTNTNNNDDCLNTCQTASCGDFVIQSNVEGCDDGNQANNDGCNALCQLESCGDGVVQPPETCDDANANNNDGCNAQCQIESCGDGILQTNEQCDDANNIDDDGCSSLCVQEVPCRPEDFALGNNFLHDPATGHCYVQILNGQSWQDAEDTCELLGGYLSIVESTQESTILASLNFFGSWLGLNDINTEGSFVTVKVNNLGFQSFAAGEPNNFNNEDCIEMRDDALWNDSTCTNQKPFFCEIELTHCGDGVAQLLKGEDCDDGNLTSGDGCDSSCKIENQFSCTGDHSVCIPSLCGNGALDPGEACDDGNNINGDGCGFACTEDFGVCDLLVVFGLFDSSLLDPTTGACYASLNTDTTWAQAESTCESISGHLVVLDSLQENQIVRSFSTSHPNAWIGYNDITNEAGESGSAFQKVTGGTIGAGFSSFDVFEMNDTPQDDCAHYIDGQNDWGAEPCDNTQPQFICEMEPRSCGDGVLQPGEECDDSNAIIGDGCHACIITPLCDASVAPGGINFLVDPQSRRCYASFLQSSTWQQAETICEARSGYLAVPESSEENTAVRGLTSPTNAAWLGINDIATEAGNVGANFQLVTGGTIGAGFQNFAAGQPNNTNAPSCVNFDANAETWSDVACTATRGNFVCEIELSPCGDGVAQTTTGEECDDSNNNDNDGCNSGCQIESCGDGVTQTIEECDDANNFQGDGCNASCQIERCGDGIINLEETCDDSNTNNSDGCDSSCQTEACAHDFCTIGAPLNDLCDPCLVNLCNFDSTCCADTWDAICAGNAQFFCGVDCNPACGDGTLDAGEACDDGNKNSFDGCSVDCTLETCGDGIINVVGEECDDGNNDFGDGCAPLCKREVTCNATVFPGADNFVNDPDSGHCLAHVTQTTSWQQAETFCESLGGYLNVIDSSLENLATKSITTPGTNTWIGFNDIAAEAGTNAANFQKVNGGIIGTGFQSFAANQPNGIGGPDCVVMQGNNANWNDLGCNNTSVTQYVCEFEFNSCGDRVIQPGETCDDDGRFDGDGCNFNCQLEFCGDGIVNNSTEKCDDGNTISGDGCEPDCSLICGADLAFAKSAVINSNGHCLVFSTNFLTWENAELACEEQGGYLAVADDAQEEALLQSIKRGLRGWIGFTDQSQEAFNNPDGFRKVTGDTSTFQNFSANEPNQANGTLNEDCAQDAGNGAWNDAVCNNRDNGLFCEIEPIPCGDGVVQPNLSETCDDGNTTNGDGCSNACAIEPGFSCTSINPAIGTPSICQ